MADLVVLALETATGCGSVALTKGNGSRGKILAEYTLQPETPHSRRLLGLIEMMMAAVDLDWEALDAVAISQGPGSFTGLRIGMAAAKGIAMAADVPLLGVPTLDGLAAQVAATSDLTICCLLDARKQQVYAAFYRYAADFSCERTSEVLALSPEDLLASIDMPTLVVGPGIAACRDMLTAHPLVRLLPTEYIHPRAALIGFCGARMVEAAGVIASNADLTPLYVRASEAELNLQEPRPGGTKR